MKPVSDAGSLETVITKPVTAKTVIVAEGAGQGGSQVMDVGSRAARVDGRVRTGIRGKTGGDERPLAFYRKELEEWSRTDPRVRKAWTDLLRSQSVQMGLPENRSRSAVIELEEKFVAQVRVLYGMYLH